MNSQKSMSRTVGFKFTIDTANVNVNIDFNKYNTNMEFRLDNTDDIHFMVIRNLSKSKFVNKYLNLKTDLSSEEQNKQLFINDERNVFTTFKNSNDVYLYLDELNDLRMCNKHIPIYKSVNYLNIKGFGIKKLKNKFLFLYVERCKYVKTSNSIVKRTAALQLQNNRKIIYI